MQDMEPRPEPKSIVFPLLGMLALLPGGVMYGFALGEATRLASDWVYLSAPLLLVGAASFTWALQRKLGSAGLGAGAFLSFCALAAAGINLQTKATARAKWQASSRALRHTSSFCTGDIKPNPDALPFTEGGPNPAVFYKTGGQSLYDSKLKPFEPSEYQLEKAALVVCLVDQTESVEKCGGYTDGAVAERVRTDAVLSAFSIKTGKKLFEKRFEGDVPRACGSVEEFYGKSKHVTISGARPAQVELVAELGSILR
jgi:hypothetical protein